MPVSASIRSISSVASAHRAGRGVDLQLAFGRRLVVVGDPGERRQAAGARLGVVALGIAALADLGRCRDMDFAEGRVGDAPRRGAIRQRRRNRGDDGDVAVAREMRRDFGQTADVFAAVLRRKAEIAVEAGAQGVAVEQDRRTAIGEQPALQRLCQRRFAGARQARQPDHRAVVAVARRALLGAQRAFHRHDVDREWRVVRRRPTAPGRRRRCGR